MGKLHEISRKKLFLSKKVTKLPALTVPEKILPVLIDSTKYKLNLYKLVPVFSLPTHQVPVRH
jgi:hypothetical protein